MAHRLCRGPAALIGAMIKIQSQTTSCASSISQAAAVAALNGAQGLLREHAMILRGKRDRLVASVNDCTGLARVAPEGTFYLLASCAGVIGKHSPDGGTIRTDRDFAAYLLESADIAVLPGEDFGMSPAIRVSFAIPPAMLEAAGLRLKRACEALR